MLLKATYEPSAMSERSIETAAVIAMVLTGIRVRGWSFHRR